jgi:hypothetical protein
MSKKNKGTKNSNEAGGVKNVQPDARIENGKKTYQGNAQNNNGKSAR